jgi:DNA-binding XRE family transcriptional regulator
MSTAPSLLAPDHPKIGQPRKFADVKAFQAAIDQYFKTQQKRRKPFTMHGLARALDCSRQTIINYERYDDEPAYVDAINRARARVAEFTEEGLWKPKQHPAGPIFSLKNNFGWKDVTETQVSVGVAIGLQAGEEQLRAVVPVVIVQAAQPAESPLKMGYAHRVETPSPALETSSPLSPAPAIAVSDVQTEAKATPARGVSPSRVV